MSIFNFVSDALVPQSLHSVCDTSLKLIHNASEEQITTAVKCNTREINSLLVQLLVLNFIVKNQNKIVNDLKIPKISETPLASSTCSSDTCNIKTQDCGTNNVLLKKYCERKLRCLSPTHGFSRNNCFVEYKIGDDIGMEILSYFKPIEIFNHFSLINKQFNKTVKIMHQSENYNYSPVFYSKNYLLQHSNELAYFWNHGKIVDSQVGNGEWLTAHMDGFERYKRKSEKFLACWQFLDF